MYAHTVENHWTIQSIVMVGDVRRSKNDQYIICL